MTRSKVFPLEHSAVEIPPLIEGSGSHLGLLRMQIFLCHHHQIFIGLLGGCFWLPIFSSIVLYWFFFLLSFFTVFLCYGDLVSVTDFVLDFHYFACHSLKKGVGLCDFRLADRDGMISKC